MRLISYRKQPEPVFNNEPSRQQIKMIFLKAFALLSISSIAQSVIFECTYEMIDYGPLKHLYACKVNKINVDEDPSIVTEIKGEHRMSDKRNPDVQALWVENNFKLLTIPSNIEAFFPNLIVISWFNGNLTTISADDFKPFPELVRIYMSYNIIKALDGDLFQHTPKMQRIHFNGNQISNVGHNLLSNLLDLVRVDLRQNDCISDNADTADQIEELKQKLEANCPPLPTEAPPSSEPQPEIDDCTPRCSLNNEVGDLRQLLNYQEERIAELEKQVKEMNANTCACTTSPQEE